MSKDFSFTVTDESFKVTLDGGWEVSVTRTPRKAAPALPAPPAHRTLPAIKRRRSASAGSYPRARARGRAMRDFADRTPGFSRRDYMTPAGNYYPNKRLKAAFGEYEASQLRTRSELPGKLGA